MRKNIIFIGIVSTLLTMDPYAAAGYQWQFLLPALFVLLYISFAPPINKLGIGYLVLNLVWVIRYCITPVLLRFSDYHIQDQLLVSLENLYLAQLLMMIEMAITVIFCSYFFNKYKNNLPHNITTNKNEKSAKFDKKDIKVSSLILLVMGALFLFILMIDREVISSFNFIFDTNFVSDSQASLGIFVLAITWSKIVITVYLVSFFADKYYKNSNPLYLSISLLIVLISISIFNGTSRNEVLIEAVAYTYLLVLLYPRYRKAIYIICMGALGFIILFITISRYFETRNISEGISNYTLENNVVTLNSYFAGQQNIAVGIKSLALYWQDYQIHTIFKDFFANAIYFNQYVTNIRGTVDIFNLTLYGHSNWADQISPTITQAIGLFGLLGIFIPILISFFIIKMDILTKKRFNVFGVFLTSYISVNIAFYSPGNITILFTALTNRFIPLFLIYLLANVYIIKKEKIRKPT